VELWSLGGVGEGPEEDDVFNNLHVLQHMALWDTNGMGWDGSTFVTIFNTWMLAWYGMGIALGAVSRVESIN
jgi:hypothetical protein